MLLYSPGQHPQNAREKFDIVNDFKVVMLYLEQNIGDNYQKRPEEVEEEPLLNGFDVEGHWEAL